ncbi:hypothetical protein V1292_001041 [Bradyrhizobium sp. AZCC 1719]
MSGKAKGRKRPRIAGRMVYKAVKFRKAIAEDAIS